MKVFVSWSGERSRLVAAALRVWVKKLVIDAELWVSTELERGVRWSTEVHTSLKEHALGILCVTPENVSSPWLNYEAGALAMHLEDNGRVIPLLLDFRSESDLREPLSQLNACTATKTGTFSLITTLNLHSDHPRSEEDLTEAFEMYWPQFDQLIVGALGSSSVPVVVPVDDKLDELILAVRRLEVSNQHSLASVPEHATTAARMEQLTSELSAPDSPVSESYPRGAGMRRGFRARVDELITLLLRSRGIDGRWAYPAGSNYGTVILELPLDQAVLDDLKETLAGQGLKITFRNARNQAERERNFGQPEDLGITGRGSVSALLKEHGITLFYFRLDRAFEVYVEDTVVDEELTRSLGQLNHPYQLITQPPSDFAQGLARSIEGTP